MFNTSDIQRTVTAAFGALLVSIVFVGAAVGPAHTSATVASISVAGQASA